MWIEFIVGCSEGFSPGTPFTKTNTFKFHSNLDLERLNSSPWLGRLGDHYNSRCLIKYLSLLFNIAKTESIVNPLKYYFMIQPYFDHCGPSSDGLSILLSDKLQKLQNRAVRGILQTNYEVLRQFAIKLINL